MEQTKIPWTENTFNPWMGCVKLSDGCDNCYAEALVRGRMGHDVWGKDKRRIITSANNWKKPLKWQRQAITENRRIKVFAGSLCDVFEKHSDLSEARERFWSLVRQTPQLDWQILTKRAQNIKPFLPEDWGEGYHNVWLGVTIESDKYVARADHLRKIPAAIRFISFEPALGSLNMLDLKGINWVIYGGESGGNYRGHDIQWARDMREKCEKAGVAFYYKQSPGVRPGTQTELDGYMVRGFPNVPVKDIDAPGPLLLSP